MVSLARPASINTPMLVLGAERDAIFTIDDVRRTAHAYGVEAEIFPAMGHDMMLDEGWQDGRYDRCLDSRKSAKAGGIIPADAAD
jgi:pimeloyl-ACP methyl ester carboxylesterase